MLFFIYLLIFHQFPQISYFELFYGVFFFRYTILILLPYDRGQYHCNIVVNACPYMTPSTAFKRYNNGISKTSLASPICKNVINIFALNTIPIAATGAFP